MKIQINTGDHVHGGESLAERVSATIETELERFKDHITRVEVHMSDENGTKGGLQDKRCMLEARLEGRNPVAVTEHSATMKQAVQGATDKLVHLLDRTLGRLHEHRKNVSDLPVRESDPAS